MEIDIPLPEITEQTQIGTYFKNLDTLITLHQRKCETLQKLKKSMLQKMFPTRLSDGQENGENVPKIRFKGFTDAWEQRELSELNSFFTDGNYGELYPKSSDMTDSSNGVPFLTGGNLKNGCLNLSGVSYITKCKHQELQSGHLQYDDVVIAVRGSLGALGYVNKGNVDWNINSQLAIIRTDKSKLNGKYLIQYLLSDAGKDKLISIQTGSALKQLPIGQLRNYVVPITKRDEQVKIGDFFSYLDNLITLHQRKPFQQNWRYDKC